MDNRISHTGLGTYTYGVDYEKISKVLFIIILYYLPLWELEINTLN